MKSYLLPAVMALCVSSAFTAAKAQTATAFAITGETQGNVNWSVIREINLNTGALVRNIYLPATEKPTHKDATSGKMVSTETAVALKQADACSCQSASMAAASAYDARQKRLYFAPLFGNELQYIDMTKKELVIYHVGGQTLKQATAPNGEADNITRMVFGADGNGYAITNDGGQFIRFTTGKNITVSNLGSLTDKEGNAISVHAKAASWGGDMIADDAGNLYLFTVAGHVFKINPSTREAAFTGTIKNLPAAFSVNAAAVNKDGNVTVASSIDASNYFSINMKTLEATAIPGKEKMYNASDFANSNLLATEKTSAALVSPAVSIVNNEMVSVFPNPVKNKLVTVYFNGTLQGRHMVEVVDVNGKKLAARSVNIMSKSQSQTLQLPASTPGGLYVVHVVGSNSKTVFTGNVVVE